MASLEKDADGFYTPGSHSIPQIRPDNPKTLQLLHPMLEKNQPPQVNASRRSVNTTCKRSVQALMQILSSRHLKSQ